MNFDLQLKWHLEMHLKKVSNITSCFKKLKPCKIVLVSSLGYKWAQTDSKHYSLNGNPPRKGFISLNVATLSF